MMMERRRRMMMRNDDEEDHSTAVAAAYNDCNGIFINFNIIIIIYIYQCIVILAILSILLCS